MSYYSVKTADGSHGCVVGDEPTARSHGEILGTLPYPASPVLARNEDTCPPFCWTPFECLNHGCCHKNRACDD